MDTSNELAPVIIFTYKKLHTLKQSIASLQSNPEAIDTVVYFFSDGPKIKFDVAAVEDVRQYLHTVNGFKYVFITETEQNKGLANSIITGVSKVVSKHKKVIVLEDDLIVSSNFLSFMNQALDYYKDNFSVFSISGFTIPIRGLNAKDIYFTRRASSWGWGTWIDRWQNIDWTVKDYETFKRSTTRKRQFNKMGSDMSSMLRRQMNNKINSWAIRWCFSQFKNGLYTVFPAISKVRNIGFANSDATHTWDKYNRFKTTLDANGGKNFNFTNDIKLNKNILSQFSRPYSLMYRTIYKILNHLF